MGDYDFTKAVFRELGAEMNFWKLAIRPGQPLAFGKIQGKLAFGLPGESRLLDGDLRTIGAACHAEDGRLPELRPPAGASDLPGEHFPNARIAVIFFAAFSGGKKGSSRFGRPVIKGPGF